MGLWDHGNLQGWLFWNPRRSIRRPRFGLMGCSDLSDITYFGKLWFCCTVVWQSTVTGNMRLEGTMGHSWVQTGKLDLVSVSDHHAAKIKKVATLKQQVVLLCNWVSREPSDGSNFSPLVFPDLSKNRLCELPEELCQFISLETLSLYHNGMRSLSSSLGNLQALTYLNLR